MKKKILSLTLVLIMSLGLVPAASASTVGTVVGSDGVRQGDFGITEDGVVVRYYGDSPNVIIPNGVKAIGPDVFSLYSDGMPDIISVTIPEGVTEIGSAAFANSRNLAQVTIPKSLTYIDGDAFNKNCPWLQNMKGDFITINGNLLDYRGSGSDVTIPGDVTIVGLGAFQDNTSITSVTVPGTVKVIDGNGRSSGSFANCTALKTVTIAEGVEEIGAYVFGGCTSLTDVTIPASVKNIDEDCTGTTYSIKAGGEQKTNPNLTIHGIKGSAAEAFAKEHNYKFVADYSAADPTTPAKPSEFSDVKDGDWFKPYVDKVTEAGLMNGIGDGKFDPQGNATNAQLMVLAYQMHSKENGTSLPKVDGPWYAPYAQYCKDHALSLNSWDPDPTDTATRFDMVSILHKAIPASRLEPVKPNVTVPDLSATAYGPVYQWYRAGILSGDAQGNFNGTNHVTRAEIAVILCQINNLM